MRKLHFHDLITQLAFYKKRLILTLLNVIYETFHLLFELLLREHRINIYSLFAQPRIIDPL